MDAAALDEPARLTREAGAWRVPTMALWEYLYGTADPEALRGYPELRYMPCRQVEAWAQNYERHLH